MDDNKRVLIVPSPSMSVLRHFEPPDIDNSHIKPWDRDEKRVWCATLFAGTVVLYSARTLLPLCVVAVAKEFHWDKTQSGTALSAFFWGYTMTQVLGGYLSDRMGGGIVMATAAVGWSLITFWTPQLVYAAGGSTVFIMVLLRVLLGCCQGFHYPSMTSIISHKVSDKERSLVYSTVSSGAHCGTLVTGSIGSLLLSHYGWHSVFYFIGLLSMCWIIFIRFFLISKARSKAQIRSIKDNILAEETPGTPRTMSVPWLQIFSKRAFWAVVFGHFCQSYAFQILLAWLPTYFHEQFPSAKGWVYNVVPWIVTIPSTILSGFLADYLIANGKSVTFTRKLIQSLCFLGYATSLFAISLTSSYYGSLFWVTIAVASSGFHNSGILVNPQDIAPKYAGSVFGIMNMAGAIPGFIGVYVVGHVLETSKNWSVVFNQTAVMCLLGWIVFSLFGTGKKIIN